MVRYLAPRLAPLPVETFWVVMLDARGRPLGESQVGLGTLSACLVHPREVFAPALRARAASVVLVHNHPSGDPAPSEEDVALTVRLAEVGDLMGIPLLDHVVVGRAGHRSIGGAATLAPRAAADPARTRGSRPAGPVRDCADAADPGVHGAVAPAERARDRGPPRLRR